MLGKGGEEREAEDVQRTLVARIDRCRQILERCYRLPLLLVSVILSEKGGLLTVESIWGIETSLLEEEICVSDQWVSSNNLNEIYHNRDLSSGKIGALETVEVGRCWFELLFEKIGLLDHDQDAFQIRSILGRREFLESFSGVISSVLPYEPVGRFWSKWQAR